MQFLLIRSIFAFLTFVGSVSSFAAEIQKVTIKTESSGWGHEEQTFEFVRQGDNFLGDGRSIHKSTVDFLLKALRQPILPKLDLGNMGIGKKWVQDNESILLTKLSPSQAKLLKAEIQKPEFIEKAVRMHYDSTWTDDTPNIEVNLFLGSETVTLRSNSQKSFMLPWTIIDGKEKRITWDAGISRSLADLMTAGSVNYDRILGKNLVIRLKRTIEWGLLRDAIEMEKAKDEFGAELELLKKKFKVHQASSAIISGLGFNVTGLHAYVSSIAAEKGIELDIHLPVTGKKLKGLKSFMEKAPQVSAMVGAVPWLSDWLKKNPMAKVEINMVDDVSLTSSARNELVGEMKKHRPFLLAEISDLLTDSALVTILEGKGQYSRWIVLPDQRMLLWHAEGLPILKWNKDKLPVSWKNSFDTYCVLVNSDGGLLRDSEK